MSFSKPWSFDVHSCCCLTSALMLLLPLTAPRAPRSTIRNFRHLCVIFGPERGKTLSTRAFWAEFYEDSTAVPDFVARALDAQQTSTQDFPRCRMRFKCCRSRTAMRSLVTMTVTSAVRARAWLPPQGHCRTWRRRRTFGLCLARRLLEGEGVAVERQRARIDP